MLSSRGELTVGSEVHVQLATVLSNNLITPYPWLDLIIYFHHHHSRFKYHRIYDGTAVTTISSACITALGSDVISLSSDSASFGDKNVGTDKTVATSLNGTDASNSNLIQATGLEADITARTSNCQWQRIRCATGLLTDDRVAGNALTLSNTSINFADKNAAADDVPDRCL